MSQIKLSLEKLSNLFKLHKYILVAAYCEETNIRFLECKTPKQQKTFLVYLPPKYTMCLNEKSLLNRFNITPTNLPPSPRQIQFMLDMKGPLLECDLLIISSQMVCMYRNSGDTECYLIGDENEDEKSKEPEDEKSKEIDEITQLEQKTIKVLQKVKPGAKLPQIPLQDSTEGQSKDSTEEETEGQSKDTSENDNIDLVFEDDSGEVFDEVRHTLNTAESKLHVVQEKINKRDGETFGDSEDEIEDLITRDNAFPPKMEDGDTILGIIYVMIDIGSFFKKIASYEEEVISLNEHLDDNELDIRKEKLSKIRETAINFLSHAEERLKKVNDEEKELKLQLMRLTVVLAQAEILKTRVEKNPDKYGEIVNESETIYSQTRETTHDLNMELLKLRDTADELLNNYQSSITELLEL
uniref:Uncharacterized protein n=1 Tax=Marseillevirus LCMAC102 TaxID=2506603 RepID=A0A481YTF3_9VIRU|nr:MAG: uncharacterized protein LCMAC102_03780 [Marseillevirus LCMAC102]